MKCGFFVITLKKLIFCIILVAVLILHFCLYFTNSKYNYVVKCFTYDLVNSFSSDKKLYEQSDNNLYFVSNINKSNFKLPNNSEYEINNGVVTFKNYSNLIVKSAGAGIVYKSDLLENGLKFVEIKHGEIITRYENLNIVGVSVNNFVDEQDVIGSVSNEKLVFKLLKNNEILNNFQIKESEIIWLN